MLSCRLRTHACAWVTLVCITALGCNGAPTRIEPAKYRDHFGQELGEETITEESVGREQMLNRRAQLELRGAAVVPIESNLEVGAGAGIKGEIETFKNLFFGVSFDWSHLETDKQIADSVNALDTAALLNADPTELFESLDRYNFLLLFDYDVPLAKSFSFRFGAGLGLALITFDEGRNPDNVSPPGYDLEPFVAFLFRPSIDFRWQVWEHGYLTAGASYDFIPTGNIEISPAKGDRSEVNGSVNFSTINLGGAWVFEW
jgi:hypothetical protein